jgi:hypothetical protein
MRLMIVVQVLHDLRLKENRVKHIDGTNSQVRNFAAVPERVSFALLSGLVEDPIQGNIQTGLRKRSVTQADKRA